jgi:hypothetical protein
MDLDEKDRLVAVAKLGEQEEDETETEDEDATGEEQTEEGNAEPVN